MSDDHADYGRVERDRLILRERLGERLRQVEHHGGVEVVLTLAEVRAVLVCLGASHVDAEVERLQRAWDEVNAMRLDEKNRADRLAALIDGPGGGS